MKDVAVMQHVIPGFVNRVGGGDSDIIKLFQRKGLPHRRPPNQPEDGSTEAVPITE